MMTRKVRKILDGLDRELLGKGPSKLSNEESRALWDILAALRGPDDEDYDDKQAVTVPVRRAAFPRLAKAARSLVTASFSEGDPEEASARRDDLAACTNSWGDESHFVRHGKSAFEALGLDW